MAKKGQTFRRYSLDLKLEAVRLVNEEHMSIREVATRLDIQNWRIVEEQEHGPIEVAILAAFLIYRYKFLSRAKDKNLYRLPEWTRT